VRPGGKTLWTEIERKLQSLGVDVTDLCTEDELAGMRSGSRILCVAPELSESVRELARRPRQHVVMVRVDEETLRKLDAWVETGAVKSRSEAAALFIREGLQIRSDELLELEQAIRGVEQARARLHEKAKSVFGRTRRAAARD
jgi:hypothetical protein